MVTLATLYNDFKTLIKQNFYDKTETDTLVNAKQDTLVSGTNIKTINNNSLLGSGNISISAGGTVDTALDTTSTNPVQNQAIANAIDDLETNVTSLNNSITNFLDNNTFTLFWTDNSNSFMYVNKAIGIGFLHFNKNVTVNANANLTIKDVYSTSATEFGYCPNVAVFSPTSIKDVFILVNYAGRIQVQNRSSSNLSNANVQGMVMWRAKHYPV